MTAQTVHFILVPFALLSFLLNSSSAESNTPQNPSTSTLTMLVMDPLSAPLACDCVKGYANRQYQRLGEYLQEKLGTKVEVYWSDSMTDALHEKTFGRCDLAIGKDSVIRRQTKSLKLRFRPIAALTDLNGRTTQRGLFVVRTLSPFATLLDLDGGTFFFGPEDCDEKWKAPRDFLKNLDVKFSKDSCSTATCSEAAKKLMEVSDSAKTIAVVSSYATPLLEGCGTIKKGDLRIVGETDELPFISVFVNEDLETRRQQEIEKNLLALNDPELLRSLESAKGFRAYDVAR